MAKDLENWWKEDECELAPWCRPHPWRAWFEKYRVTLWSRSDTDEDVRLTIEEIARRCWGGIL